MRQSNWFKHPNAMFVLYFASRAYTIFNHWISYIYIYFWYPQNKFKSFFFLYLLILFPEWICISFFPVIFHFPRFFLSGHSHHNNTILSIYGDVMHIWWGGWIHFGRLKFNLNTHIIICISKHPVHWFSPNVQIYILCYIAAA